MGIATQPKDEVTPTSTVPLLVPQDEVVEPPAHHKGSRLKVLAVLAVIAAAGTGLAAKFGLLGTGSARVQTRMHRVERTRLPITFNARGSLESGRNRDVVNRVEGQTVILFLAPDGSVVKKGDLICELDASALRDKLTAERITIQQAEADVQNAVKTREVCEFALREYEGGTYPQERQNADIALQTAETNLSQAAERLEWSNRMFARGFVARSRTVADRDSKANCEITFDRSRGKIAVLEGYTKRKNLIHLTANVEKARSDELSKKAKLALEETKKKKYETLIERCKLYAPVDGLVIHNNEQSMRGSQQAILQEGGVAREGQVLVKIPDITAMRVNAKLDESIVSRVSPNSKARIRIDALPGVVLDGAVTTVQAMADPISRDMTAEVRLYTAYISIDNAPSSLRPGMTANLELLVSEAEDVLAVPAEAVLQVGSETFVYVATATGPSRRGVMVGGDNGKLVEIIGGLEVGEFVSLDPMALMSEHEKRQAFATITNGSTNWR